VLSFRILLPFTIEVKQGVSGIVFQLYTEGAGLYYFFLPTTIIITGIRMSDLIMIYESN